MMCSKSVSICNRFHTRRANSGKITISEGSTPLWCPRSRRISSPSATKLLHKKLDETLGYHMVKTRCLYLTWPWIGVPGRDRRTDGQTESPQLIRAQQYLPVLLLLSRVKTDCCWLQYIPLCHWALRLRSSYTCTVSYHTHTHIPRRKCIYYTTTHIRLKGFHLKVSIISINIYHKTRQLGEVL